MAIFHIFEHLKQITNSRINQIKRKQHFKYKYI